MKNMYDYDMENILDQTRERLIELVSKFKELDDTEAKSDLMGNFDAPINDIIDTVEGVIEETIILRKVCEEKISIDEAMDRFKTLCLDIISEENS